MLAQQCIAPSPMLHCYTANEVVLAPLSEVVGVSSRGGYFATEANKYGTKSSRAIIRENASYWFMLEIVPAETNSAVFPFIGHSAEC